MTKEFETLLCLFGDSALGRKSRIKSVDNPDKLIDVAIKQGVWSCVYPSLNEICDVKKYYLDFLTFVSKSISRNEFTMNVIFDAMQSDIKVCILKGVSVALMYANPDYRISSDTDILIEKNDENKMAEFLVSKGYEVKKRKKNDHHMTAKHPIGGLLEVHVSLYNEITADVVLGGKIGYSQPWTEIYVGERRFYTLGLKDNLLYLTAHYIKHYISGGSSIRQMMDLLLFIKKHKDLLDLDEYRLILRELRYESLIDAVMSVGVKYFGFDGKVSDDVQMKYLLDDIEICGLFGSNSSGRTTVYNEFCKKRRSVSGAKLKLLLWFKSENTIFSRIFPSQKSLVAMGYTYSNNKLLIPFAWIHKLFDYLFKRNKVRNEFLNNDVVSKRIETMRKLSIID